MVVEIFASAIIKGPYSHLPLPTFLCHATTPPSDRNRVYITLAYSIKDTIDLLFYSAPLPVFAWSNHSTNDNKPLAAFDDDRAQISGAVSLSRSFLSEIPPKAASVNLKNVPPHCLNEFLLIFECYFDPSNHSLLTVFQVMQSNGCLRYTPRFSDIPAVPFTPDVLLMVLTSAQAYLLST